MSQPNQPISAVFASGLLFSAGAKVDQAANHPTLFTNISSVDDRVPPMVGVRHKSHVHLIGHRYKFVGHGSNFMKVDGTSGIAVLDFGEITPSPVQKHPSSPIFSGSPLSCLINSSFANPNPDDIWVVYCEWDNTSTTHIISFGTDWKVPPNLLTT